MAIRAGSSARLTFALKDYDGASFPEASVSTLTLRIYDVASGVEVKGVTNVKDANGGTLNPDGTGTVVIPGGDNVIKSSSLEIGDVETHAAVLAFTGSGGEAGSGEVRFDVEKIG